MKILVGAKRVIDPDARIKLLPDGAGVDVDSAEYKINPFCENAIEEALRLKDAHDAEVVLVTIGPDDVTKTIRQGLAMGAGRARRGDGEDTALDSDLAARILAAVYREEEADLFLLGKQAVDGDNNQVGQLMAQYLGLPQACFASELELDDGTLTVTREVDGGLETISMSLPAIVTADLRLNEPRYASLPGIMKAKRKPVTQYTPGDLGVEVGADNAAVTLSDWALPPARPEGRILEGELSDQVAELVQLLRNEAKVL